MTIETTKYTRKPFEVEGIQVTQENFDEVAAWCSGEIQGKGDGTRFIHVRVHQPMTEGQKHAFVGDWVLYSRRGYKVYKDRAFRNNFTVEDSAKPGPKKVKNVFNPVISPEQAEALQELRTVDVPVDPADQISGKNPCVKGKVGSVVWLRQEPCPTCGATGKR